MVPDRNVDEQAGLTDEEAANIAVVRAFLAAPHADIDRYRTPDHRVERAAFARLPAVSGLTAEQFTRYINHREEPGLSARQDSIEQIIARGDTVWVRWTVRGSHTGTLFGLPPTGRRIEMIEVSILRLRDGRVAESWFLADELGLLLQLGADPAQIRASIGRAPTTG